MDGIIKKLKPHVTKFSASIPTDCKHGDSLVVGGVVVDIFNLAELLQHAEDETFRSEGVYVTLDDGVGTNLIVLPYSVFLKASEKYGGVNKGDLFLAQGRVFRLDTTHTYEGLRGKKVTVDVHQDETLRILAWDILPLPKNPPKKKKKPELS